MLPYYDPKYFFWKVDADGNVKDMSAEFRKIARPPRQRNFPFQLLEHQENLYMISHSTNMDGVGQTIIARLDTMLNVVFTNKVAYKLKLGEGRLQQETLVNGNTLYILKTVDGGTELGIMKINLDNGDIINNTYKSTFIYSEPRFKYNDADSTITIYSVLTQQGMGTNLKRYVFVSRMNNTLAEETPFSILRSQFLNNSGINFLSVEGYPWTVLRSGQSSFSFYEVNNPNNSIGDTTFRTMMRPSIGNTARYYSDAGKQPVRISLFDKKFKLRQDSVIQNNKNSYTLLTDQYTAFVSGDKYYLLVLQRFFKKNYGFLLINENDNNLSFADVRVNNRNEYLLSQAKRVANGVVIPYKHKREAGLVMISKD
jgi:hypothetical protein